MTTPKHKKACRLEADIYCTLRQFRAETVVVYETGETEYLSTLIRTTDDVDTYLDHTMHALIDWTDYETGNNPHEEITNRIEKTLTT